MRSPFDDYGSSVGSRRASTTRRCAAGAVLRVPVGAAAIAAFALALAQRVRRPGRLHLDVYSGEMRRLAEDTAEGFEETFLGWPFSHTWVLSDFMGHGSYSSYNCLSAGAGNTIVAMILMYCVYRTASKVSASLRRGASFSLVRLLGFVSTICFMLGVGAADARKLSDWCTSRMGEVPSPSILALADQPSAFAVIIALAIACALLTLESYTFNALHWAFGAVSKRRTKSAGCPPT